MDLLNALRNRLWPESGAEPGQETDGGVTAAAAAERGQELRVLMMPDSTAANPYQRRLVEGLRAAGVGVTLVNPAGRLPLLTAARGPARPDVVHLHWTHALVLGRSLPRSLLKSARFLLELAVLRWRGIRVVWTAHNLVEHERRFPRLELAVGRAAARLYNRIIVHCEAAGDIIARAYGMDGAARQRLSAVPHGHFIGVYDDTLDRADARRQVGVERGAPVFAHIGQIRPYKGVFDLLDAFARLHHPAARLVIAGKPWNGRLAAELQRRAQRDERIRLFLGFVPDEHMQTYLRAADAVVLPYRDILTSGSAMLGMSFARAVIMPRCGCAAQMLGDAGPLLYDPADPEGLDHALAAATADVDLDAVGRANLERARRFSWEGIATATVRAYRGEPA